MRKAIAVIVLGIVAAATAGCGDDDRGAPLVLLGTTAGVAVLDTATGTLDEPAGVAVTSPGGELLVRAAWQGTRTEVRTIAVDGTTAWTTDLEGTYEPRTTTWDGDRVALTPPLEPGTPELLAPGRSRTDLAIVHENGEVQRFDVAGNIEPEAFSLDETALFVLSYEPPEAPATYQVRRLDLTTGDVGDVFSVDAELQQAMRATARTQAWDADGDRLYTLYTSGEGGHATTFVHVLDLDEQWAHCIHVPLTLVPETAGMALAEGGQGLFVADALTGTVAEIDTEDLTVARSAHLPGLENATQTSVATGRDEIYVAGGNQLHRLDRGSLEVIETASVAADVVGVQRSRATDELFVAVADAVAVLHPETLAQVRSWRIDTHRTGNVLSLGGRSVLGYAGVQCAC